MLLHDSFLIQIKLLFREEEYRIFPLSTSVIERDNQRGNYVEQREKGLHVLLDMHGFPSTHPAVYYIALNAAAACLHTPSKLDASSCASRAWCRVSLSSSSSSSSSSTQQTRYLMRLFNQSRVSECTHHTYGVFPGPQEGLARNTRQQQYEQGIKSLWQFMNVC
jgi:hypothetical protein